MLFEISAQHNLKRLSYATRANVYSPLIHSLVAQLIANAANELYLDR